MKLVEFRCDDLSRATTTELAKIDRPFAVEATLRIGLKVYSD